MYPNPLTRPLLSATQVEWHRYHAESGQRLQQGDEGYVLWTQAKHDLLIWIQDACVAAYDPTAGGPVSQYVQDFEDSFPVPLHEL